ncbi:hypothetical protein [Streptomyces sp. NBC_00076]|uniref:hypothetical protein n=1 Tax=Streptomyces sp. NBC_00076 TaxID=2975642 RepID=UPI00324BCDDF
MGFESWLELGHLMWLDSEPDVVAFASQPFRLPRRLGDQARRVSHTPDYFVRRRDGTAAVLDVAGLPSGSGRPAQRPQRTAPGLDPVRDPPLGATGVALPAGPFAATPRWACRRCVARRTGAPGQGVMVGMSKHRPGLHPASPLDWPGRRSPPPTSSTLPIYRRS